MSITLSLPNYELTGVIRHDANLRILELIDPDTGDSEVLSITLPDHSPASECVFVKDYSEHRGLTAALIRVGVGVVIRELKIGCFRSRVIELRVLT
ncbi:hypothetical protein [Corynebacterium lujinxingii]|uniref:Uncharacterized protein n=1 Tax=Corynebacterium lujinxingii TaxID=2763010 RepID=A0A7H0JXT5_9CORY|nr:hypothetical protein [Corynebacterium lujinxingii]MBC3179867.1 hypothetical protein [Corynebacterium lujinxingii]NNO11728.1 hypothetical protein [Corynebacterium lujinxingii]QNP89851.1 hypothetical protein IAU68_09225 [Corynebacterium lujinxingii]